jgi:hypothetical protein
MKPVKAILIFLGLVAMAVPSQASTILYFEQITNNGTPADNVESQLSVEVIDNADGTVSFKFFNNVGTDSSIVEIYFDDGTLLGLSTVTDSDDAGTAVEFGFGDDVNPGNLAGGGSLADPFNATVAFSIDSENPQVARGVNASSEWVMTTFTLINEMTYADTLAALEQGAGDGGLRIGLHVAGIDGSGADISNSYVNGPPDDVPDGGTTLSLLGGALLGLGMLRRKFNL